MTESDVEAAARRRLGATLRGKYRIDRLLGVGGMAVVYAATHRNGREFAVKMLHPEISVHSDIRARFLREGYVANALKHPGVVAVLDDDVAEDGAAFLVMELLEGETVDALWDRSGRRLPLERAFVVGAQLLDVLGAAHARGILHRDIKPANLFWTREGRIKVLDFGIARIRDAALATTNATQTGMMMGTPAYMAPEQALARSHAMDGRTDLWATGATLFALLSGRTVHEGENAQHLLVKTATEPARPLASLAPQVPPVIAHVVDRALAFDPAARWPDAASMADAWRDAFTRVYGAGVVDAAVPSGVGGEGVPAGSAPTGFVPPPAHAMSSTTPQPVHIGRSTATLQAPEAPPRGRRGGRAALVAAVSIGGVALVGAGAFSLRSGARKDATPGPTASVPAMAPPEAEAPPSLPSATTATTVPMPATPDEPPRPGPSSTRQARPTQRTNPPAGRPAATAKPDCNPSFVLDADGNKHFKPECF